MGVGSNRCVDISGLNTANGTPIQLWDCTGNWNQRWTSTNGALVNPQSGKCLNAPGTANGTRLTLSTCTGSTAQQWQIRSNGNIANVQSGRCLDAVNQGTGNGTLLQIYDCIAQARPTSGGRYGPDRSRVSVPAPDYTTALLGPAGHP